MARSSNATQLSAALTRAEQAETERDDLRKQVAALEEKLALARELYSELRSQLPKPRVETEAQRAYREGAARRRAEHEARIHAAREQSKLYFASHPEAKSATTAQISEWFEANRAAIEASDEG